ncbi:MAG: hypothetical protein GY757_06920 [bacterium]|nr:hypothetical protein [bacterium]
MISCLQEAQIKNKENIPIINNGIVRYIGVGLALSLLVILFLLAPTACKGEHDGKVVKLHFGRPDSSDYKYVTGAVIYWRKGEDITIRLYEIYFASTDTFKVKTKRRIRRILNYDFRNHPSRLFNPAYLNKYGRVTRVEFLPQSEEEYADNCNRRFARELGLK